MKSQLYCAPNGTVKKIARIRLGTTKDGKAINFDVKPDLHSQLSEIADMTTGGMRAALRQAAAEGAPIVIEKLRRRTNIRRNNREQTGTVLMPVFSDTAAEIRAEAAARGLTVELLMEEVWACYLKTEELQAGRREA